MDRQEALDGFELQENRSLDDNVCAVRIGYLDPGVIHRDRYFLLERQSIQMQLSNKTCSIRLFQQPGAEGTMYLDRACEDPPGKFRQWIFVPWSLHASPFLGPNSTRRQTKPPTQ